jgi:hypothetical protein
MRRMKMAKKDRKAMVDALKKRTQESSNRKSGGFISIFKSDLEDVSFWKCKEGDHTLDIIPYYVGENDPHVKLDEPGYVLELKVHQQIGPSEGSYICPAENFNKPCPVCEHRRVLKQQGADDDDIKALYPKNRCVYNVVCYDTAEEEDKGVQVWEVSRWLSERYFTKLAKPKRRRGGESTEPINFASPVGGKTIEFTREGTGATNTAYIGHSFLDRDYDIEEDILDLAHCLDDLVIVPTYAELYEAYWGEELEEDAKEGKEEEKEEEKESKPRRGRGKKEEKEEKKEEESKPRRGRKKEEKEEEEPKPRGRGKKEEKEEIKCPGGGVFGIDIDTLDDCEDCDLWKPCAKENVKSKKEDDKEEKKEEKKEKGTTSRRRRRR